MSERDGEKSANHRDHEHHRHQYPRSVHALAALFGVSAWVAINGLWQQTPILVVQLPESWNLASYIVLITQLANIGPLIYSLLKRCFANKQLELYSIHITYAIGLAALALLIAFWDRVGSIGGEQHSIAFLSLTFFLAIVDCSSSVLYVPYMSSIASTFLVSHLVGQSLSGLVPSFLALAQGVGGNPDCVNGTDGHLKPAALQPNFSVSIFFAALTAIVVVSWLAFVALDRFRKHFSKLLITATDGISSGNRNGSIVGIRLNHDDNDNCVGREGVIVTGTSSTDALRPKSNSLSFRTLCTLLIAEASICALTNGILPSIQPYSVLVYGNVAHHLVVSFTAIASAVGTYTSLFVVARRRAVILSAAISIATACAIYIVASALSSPHRLIQSPQFGTAAIIIVWVANNFLFAFSRAAIMRTLRTHCDANRWLFYGGVATQIGSFIGSIAMFLVLNFTQLFHTYSPCSDTQ